MFSFGWLLTACWDVGFLGEVSFPEKKKPPPDPQRKVLVLTWAQIPFLVGGLLPVDRGKSTGASVRPVVPLAPLSLTRA